MPLKEQKPILSVIIPTRNRAEQLERALTSIIKQQIEPTAYEIIIIDNGSRDLTPQVAQSAQAANTDHLIMYVREPNPGLHAGRHCGAKTARADLLVFVDDDIEAAPEWLSAISVGFSDPATGIIGGPSWPVFEISPPKWLSLFATTSNDRMTCGPLSLIDLGQQSITISPDNVWGLNFSIRKSLLYELGGFHPDSVPRQYLHFRGDGETGLSMKAKAAGVKTVYIPQAQVYHHVPRTRLTVEYFKTRFFNQGISDAFTAIRSNGGLNGLPLERLVSDDRIFTGGEHKFASDIGRNVQRAYVDGYLSHYHAVTHDPDLLRWVLRPDYFEAAIPDYLDGPADQPPNQSSVSVVAREAKAPIPKTHAGSDSDLMRQAQQKYDESQFQEALKILEALCRQKRSFAGAHYLKAVVLMNMGRLAEALKAARTEKRISNERQRISSLIAMISQLKPYEKIIRVPTHMKVDERVLLLELAQKVPPNGVIVEIGSYLGASACFLAEGSKERKATVFCVDTWMNDAMSEGQMDTLTRYLANTRAYRNAIVPLRGKSDQIARSFVKPIDLLFIDGDHSYDGCKRDILEWYPKLNDGAHVIFHDYGWSKDIQKAVHAYSQPLEIQNGSSLNTIYWSRVARKN